MMRKVLRFGLMALLFAGQAFSADKPMLIDGVPIDTETFAAFNGATVEQFHAQKAAFQKDVQALLQGEYQVVAERFFILQPRGALIVTGIDNYVSETLHGRRVLARTLLSAASITLWKKGQGYFALALSPVLPDGNTMYDLVELSKIEKSDPAKRH